MPGLRAPGDRVDLTLESVTQTTALYSLYTALGDPLSGTIYATDSSNNTVTAAIVTDPGTGVITAEFTSLNPATTYSIPPQAVTGSDAGIQSTYTFTTLDVPQKLYGSVNGGAKRVRKLYFGYGVTQEITNTTLVAAFDTDDFIAAAASWTNNPAYITYDYLKAHPVIRLQNNSNDVRILVGSNKSLIINSQANFVQFVALGGITWTDNAYNTWDTIRALPTGGQFVLLTAGFPFVTKKIAKLYGSVNGSAKLIYEDPNA